MVEEKYLGYLTYLELKVVESILIYRFTVIFKIGVIRGPFYATLAISTNGSCLAAQPDRSADQKQWANEQYKNSWKLASFAKISG